MKNQITLEEFMNKVYCYGENRQRIINKEEINKIIEIDLQGRLKGKYLPEYINEFKNLKKFRSFTTKLKYLPELKLENLEELNLSNNRLMEMPNLSYCKKLKILNLSHNKIRKIEGLENCIDLVNLDINGNEITKIENLNHNINLEKLEIENNEIEDLNGLENNKQLKFLNLSHNEIEKIENMENQINLETLRLDNNLISKIEGLDKCINLKSLNLSHNGIEIIENLDFKKKMMYSSEYLKLEYNPLKYSKYKTIKNFKLILGKYKENFKEIDQEGIRKLYLNYETMLKEDKLNDKIKGLKINNDINFGY